ncbi:hypothetical protein Tcan_02695 [Toxocara canis]|uniref:Uncharacterized protein n=2 Tax=Toxocara canis TaxID=6265 RepID=A0A0B2VI92_TOXCA|nr:hypothetical protein Tcan_02695 [Toxocara canis]VDM39029.1 unnamed protein product [Toxocara canis]
MQKSLTESENSSCSTSSGHYLIFAGGSSSAFPVGRTCTLHTAAAAAAAASDCLDAASSSSLNLPSSGYVLYEEEEDLETPSALRKVFHMAADGHGRPQKLVELDTQYHFAQQREMLFGETPFYSVDTEYEDDRQFQRCIAVDSEYTLTNDDEVSEGRAVGQTGIAQVAYVFETGNTRAAAVSTSPVAMPLSSEDVLSESANCHREAKKKLNEDVRLVRSKEATLTEEDEEEKLTLPSPAMLNDMMSKVQSRCFYPFRSSKSLRSCFSLTMMTHFSCRVRSVQC